MNIRSISFGAKIDKNTLNFLIKARENNLDTKKMEILMKQISPEGKIISATDMDGNLLFMYNSGKNYRNILHDKTNMRNQDIPYKTNQATVNLITSKLENIKRNEKNVSNEKIKFLEIYKRDHKAELKEIFGEPVISIFNNAAIEKDY